VGYINFQIGNKLHLATRLSQKTEYNALPIVAKRNTHPVTSE